MLTCGKLLLVEYKMEQEKWGRKFGFGDKRKKKKYKNMYNIV